MFEDEGHGVSGGHDVSGSEVIIADSQNSMPNEIHQIERELNFEWARSRMVQ